MRTKTKTMEYFFQLTHALSMLLVMGTGITAAWLPDVISTKSDMHPNIIRVIVVVLGTAIANGLTKGCYERWLNQYNEILKKETYEIQQALKEQGRVDINDIDWSIHVLQLIKDAVNSNETEEKKSE